MGKEKEKKEQRLRNLGEKSQVLTFMSFGVTDEEEEERRAKKYLKES